MANYATLKAAIQAAIKNNGNNEITGNLLQAQLLSMINSLGNGYQFVGVATPSTTPGTPDPNVFYLASTAGTYVNFDNITVSYREIAILYYNGTWRKSVLQIPDYRIEGWLNQTRNIKFSGNGQTITFAQNGFSIYRDNIRVAIAAAADKTFTFGQVTREYLVIPGGAIDFSESGEISVSDFGDYVVKKNDLGRTDIVLAWYYHGNFQGGLLSDIYLAEMSADYRIEGWMDQAQRIKFSGNGKTITFGKNGFSIYRDDIRVAIAAAADKTFTFGQSTREYLVIPAGTIDFSAGASLTITDFGNYITKKTTLARTDIVLAWYYLGNFQGGLLSELYLAGRISPLSGVMTEVSNLENLHFGDRKLTISTRGFTLFVDGQRYSIEGGGDYVFDYSQNVTRKYLCVDYDAVLRGELTLAGALVVLDNVVPGRNHITLLSTYINTPQPYGLFYNAFLNQLIKGDTAGDAIFADVETPGKRFAALYNGSGSTLSMLFFTDPHTIYGGGSNPATFNSPYYPTFFTSLAYLQKFANMLPFDFVLSGGDWINQNDTKDMACYELGQIKALLEAKFKKCYRLLGNHDTNYQGKDTESSAAGTGTLDQQTIISLLYNDIGRAYYKIERHNCDIYCFDSGIDHRTTLSSYDKTQLNWFAQELVSNTKPDIVLSSHIIMEGTSDSPQISVLANAIEQIADAFNRRTSVVVDGTTYAFGNVTAGKVRCIIGGHTHYDYMDESAAVPIFITRNFVAPTSLPSMATYTFDLILIDFTAGVLNAVRVGNGSDRTLNLA